MGDAVAAQLVGHETTRFLSLAPQESPKEAQAVAMVEPHGVADDVGRKAMPQVAGSTLCRPDIVPRGE